MKRSNNYGILKTESLTDASDILSSKGEEARRERMDELNTKAGYPESQDVEEIRNTKVLEIDSLDEDGTNPHPKFPGQVNESGEDVGTYIDDEGKDVTKAFMKYLSKARGEGGGKGWYELARSKSPADRELAFSILDQRAHKFTSPNSRKARMHEELWREFGEGEYQFEGLQGLESPSPRQRASERKWAEHSQEVGRNPAGYTGRGITREPGFKDTVVPSSRLYPEVPSGQADDQELPMKIRSKGGQLKMPLPEKMMKEEEGDFARIDQLLSTMESEKGREDEERLSPEDYLSDFTDGFKEAYAGHEELLNEWKSDGLVPTLHDVFDEYEYGIEGEGHYDDAERGPVFNPATHDRDAVKDLMRQHIKDAPKYDANATLYNKLLSLPEQNESVESSYGGYKLDPRTTPKGTPGKPSSTFAGQNTPSAGSILSMEKNILKAFNKYLMKRDVYEDIATVMSNQPEEFEGVDMEAYRKKNVKDLNQKAAAQGVNLPESLQNSILKAYNKYLMKAKKYKNIKDKIKSKDPKHQQQAYEQLKPREAAFFPTSPKAKHVADMDAHKAEHGKFPWDTETPS